MSGLTATQSNILDKFIGEFLPIRGNRRKNSENELDYVTKTLDRIFNQNFGFKLRRHLVLKAFRNLGYTIFEKEGNIDYDNKTFKPADNGNVKTKTEGLGLITEAPFTYIDLSAETIRNLMKTTNQLPGTTHSKTFYKVEEMKLNIQRFKSQLIENNIS